MTFTYVWHRTHFTSMLNVSIQLPLIMKRPSRGFLRSVMPTPKPEILVPPILTACRKLRDRIWALPAGSRERTV